MRECGNEELRDALPGYVAGRLAGPDRARVAEHIAACADCAAEAELLRVAHQVMMQDAPRVDARRIVAALPAPPRGVTGPVLVRSGADMAPTAPTGPTTRPVVQRPARASAFRPVRTGWRIAAAVSAIALGGLSVAVVRDLGVSRRGPITVPAVVASAATQSAPATRGGDTEPIASADPGMALGGGLSDLSDVEMEGLLRDLDGIEASPSDEPDAAAPGLHAAVVQ
ncbi:MAG: zf-HC2 domain-containing protein [Gemmatimonadales bacterium]|jgi:anti-sigma factor RsiW